MKVDFSTPFSGITKITWDFADGNIVTTSGTSASHTYLKPGKYVPTVIFYGPVCAASAVGIDTIRVDTLSMDFSWTTPCEGVPFTLTQNTSAIYNPPTSWAWYFAPGDTAAGPTATHSFPTGGAHPVTLVAANGFGCADTLTKDVVVNFSPQIIAPADTALCPGDTASLTATGAVSYTWSPASMVSCTACQTTQVYATQDTAMYYVQGTDEKGCIGRDSTRVVIQIKTTSSTGSGGEICVGESFRLHAEGAISYEWMPASSLDSPRIAAPLATPTSTTTYIVAAVEGSCLIDSQRVTVVVHSRPLFSAGTDEVIALGAAVTLRPTQSGIVRIAWVADSTLSCVDCFRPNAHPHYTRTYYATGYNEHGCSETDCVTVHVR